MEAGAGTQHTAKERLQSVTTGRYEEKGALHLRKCWEPDIIVMRKVPETKETAAKHVAFEL